MKYAISTMLTKDMPMQSPIMPPRLAIRDITDIICTAVRMMVYTMAYLVRLVFYSEHFLYVGGHLDQVLLGIVEHLLLEAVQLVGGHVELCQELGQQGWKKTENLRMQKTLLMEMPVKGKRKMHRP